MNKHDISVQLRQALNTERASAVAVDNIMSTMNWSGLAPSQRETVVAALDQLRSSFKRRTGRLEKLLRKL